MEFFVYFSKSATLCRHTGKVEAVGDDLLEYDFLHPFHCFKLKKSRRTTRSGVETINEQIMDTDEFLYSNDGKRIVTLSFVFVNTSNGFIYCHNCTFKRLKDLLMAHFMTSDVAAGVDADKLEVISGIEITFSGDPKLHQYGNLYASNVVSIDDALGMNDMGMETATVKILMGKPSIFSKDKLRKFLSKQWQNVIIKGYDASDNIIRIAESIQLIIKIDVDCGTIVELNELPFAGMIAKIEERHREGGLDAYG